jgi:hypothetical protein
MEKNFSTKKILLWVAGILVTLAGGYGVNELGAGRLNYQERTWLNELAATTTASNIVVSNVTDFSHIGVTVASTAASGTLKFACSMQDTAPTFTSTQSATNRWDYVDFTDFQNNTSVDGDTGIVLAGTTDVRQFYITGDNFRWCTAMLTPWTAGTTTVTMLPANNQ